MPNVADFPILSGMLFVQIAISFHAASMNKNDFIVELDKLGIDVTKNKLDQLEKYYEMLIAYNKIASDEFL